MIRKGRLKWLAKQNAIAQGTFIASCLSLPASTCGISPTHAEFTQYCDGYLFNFELPFGQICVVNALFVEFESIGYLPARKSSRGYLRCGFR